MVFAMLTRQRPIFAKALTWLAVLASTFLWEPLALAGTNEHVVLITIDGFAASYLSDPQAPLPNLRRLAEEGASAKAMHVSNPATTWPNHTTLITGVHPDKHSVLVNGLLVRTGPGRPVTIEGDHNQAELVAVPTLYDLLHRAGYRTAAINWPCTRGATNLDDNFPDTPDRLAQTTPRLRAELVRDGVLEDMKDSSFLRKGPTAADKAWSAAAVHLLEARPPSLLLLHLLDTDAAQHRYGPNSEKAYQALGRADGQVGEVLRAVERLGMRAHTTVFVVSDHGFARPSKLVNPNVPLRRAGLLRPGPHRRAQCISEGGTAFVYLTDPSTAKADRSKVIELLRNVEGIDQIVEPANYSALHLPGPSQNQSMGDLLLVAKDSYAFSDESFEEDIITPIPIPLGSHGYLSTDPRMDGVFIAWGNQIKAGSKLGTIENIDVAPTVAALFGQRLPNAEGRVIREIHAGPE